MNAKQAAGSVAYTGVEKTKVEANADQSGAWDAAVTYDVSKADKVKATYNSRNQAAVEVSHTEGIAKIVLKAPLAANPAANATLTVERAWDL